MHLTTPERSPTILDQTPFTFTIIMNCNCRGNCHDLPVTLSITSTENSNQPHAISDFCHILSMVVATISSRRPAFDLENDSFVIWGISNSDWLESFPEAWHGILQEIKWVHNVIHLFVITVVRCVIQTALVPAVACDGLHMLRNRYQARSESWVYETRQNRLFLPAASKEQVPAWEGSNIPIRDLHNSTIKPNNVIGKPFFLLFWGKICKLTVT